MGGGGDGFLDAITYGIAMATGVRNAPLGASTEAPRTAPTQLEIEQVNRLLGQVEHNLMTLHESLAAIRFGLACAGHPVTIDQCLDHPMFEKALRARESARDAERMREQMEFKKAEMEYKYHINIGGEAETPERDKARRITMAEILKNLGSFKA